MKKFVFIFYGCETPTQEIREAWNSWFTSIGDKIVDGGNPFGEGREITHTETKELPFGVEAVAGYTIINANSMDEAEEIAKGSPMVTAVRVYEALPM